MGRPIFKDKESKKICIRFSLDQYKFLEEESMKNERSVNQQVRYIINYYRKKKYG